MILVMGLVLLERVLLVLFESSGHVPESNLGTGKLLHYSGQFDRVCAVKVVRIENLGLEAEYGIRPPSQGSLCKVGSCFRTRRISGPCRSSMVTLDFDWQW